MWPKFWREAAGGATGRAQFAVLAVDAVAPSIPIMRQRLEKHLAMQNETRSPWGPIELRLSVGAWSANDGRTFGEFLDAVEADLRLVNAETKPQILVLRHAVRG